MYLVTAMTTLASAGPTTPTRWWRATLWTSGHLARTWPQSSPSFLTAIGSYASYSKQTTLLPWQGGVFRYGRSQRNFSTSLQASLNRQPKKVNLKQIPLRGTPIKFEVIKILSRFSATISNSLSWQNLEFFGKFLEFFKKKFLELFREFLEFIIKCYIISKIS